MYELRQEPTTLGGAINIPSNGLRLLGRLSIYDQLAARASSASRLIVHSMQSAVLADVDMAGWSRTKTGFGFMRALRYDLIDVLLKAAEKENIPIYFGKRMVGISEDDKEVTVTFSDGTTATADLLLGCDGIHSDVRRLHVNPTVSPEYSGISNMFTILPTSRLTRGEEAISPALHGTLTPEGLLGVMPCTA